jgi:hypothetical protein
LYIAAAGESLTQYAPHAVVRRLIGEHELCLAFTAEVFLPGLHGTVTGRDSHRANLDAATALLTELRLDAEGVVHMAVLATSDKANRPGSPDFSADPDTAAA